jgi:tetratricopeptide (TPR) repeat protein
MCVAILRTLAIIASFMLRIFVSFVITLLALDLLGCSAAHHAPPPQAVQNVAAHPATQAAPLDPRALLPLDQIGPQATLQAPATQPSDPPSVEAVRLFAQAHIAELDENIPGAIDLLKKAVKLDPTSFQLHYTLGQLYLGQAPYNNDSIHELEEAASIEPDHLELQTNLGRQYLAKNDGAAAMIYLRLATQTSEYKLADASSVIADFFLAGALEKQGYDQAALTVYQRLAARLRSPSMAMRMDRQTEVLLDHVGALSAQIAELLQKLRRYDQAAAAYREAVQSDPGNFELRAHECSCLIAGGKNEQAAAAATECVMKLGATPQTLDLLREVYRSFGRDSDAIDALSRLYRQHPNQRSLLYALTDLMSSSGRADQADRLLAEAARKKPMDGAILARRFEIRRASGDIKGAAQLLVETSADHPEMADDVAPLWAKLTIPGAADRLRIAGVKALTASSHAQAAKLFWLSRAQRGAHRDAAARDALEQAVNLKPPFAPAFRDLVDVLWPDQDVTAAAKVEASSKLADRAASAGDQSLAAEVKGLALLHQNEPAKAAQQFADAIKAGGKSPDLLLSRAQALRSSGDDHGFESLMWKLISDWPTLRDPYLELYAYYLKASAASQAQRVLTAWFSNDPQSALARELEAREEIRAGHLEIADRIYARLLSDHPDDPEVLEAVQDYYRQTDRTNDFLHRLEQLRGKDPKNLTLAIALAETYSQANRNSDASRVLDETRKSAADDADVLYILSGLYAKIGQKQTAQQVLADILKLDPTHAGASNDLGYSLADDGKNLSHAESLIRQAIAIEPHNASFLDSMGWVLYKLGRFAEARGYLDRAIGPPNSAAESEADPVVLDHRGDVLYRLGDHAAAASDWKKAAQKIADAKDEREDLHDLRLQLLEKQKQLSAGKPVSVPPTGGQ